MDRKKITSFSVEVLSRLHSPLQRVSLLLVVFGCVLFLVSFVFFKIDYGQYGYFWAMTASHSIWFAGYKLLFRAAIILVAVGLYLAITHYYSPRFKLSSEKWYDWIKTGEWPKDP